MLTNSYAKIFRLLSYAEQVVLQFDHHSSAVVTKIRSAVHLLAAVN